MDLGRARFLLLVIIYLGFISLGLPDGSLGVAWPQLHVELGLPIGLAGTIMIVTTLLSAASGFSSGRVVGRFRTGPVVLFSGLLTGFALLAISQAAGLAWMLLAAVPLGLGAGAVDAGLNGYVARHYTGRHMNWLHACWGLGATCGPLIMAQAVAHPSGWRSGYLILASAQLFLALIFLLSLGLWSRVPERHAAALDPGANEKPPTATAHSFAGWLSAIIFAIYVAVETTVGLWASSILVFARDFSRESAGFCTAAYYGAITTGRFLAGTIVDRWGSRRIVAVGGIVALGGALLFVISGYSVASAAISLVLVGLGFAPIYPGLMHDVPRRFVPESVQTVIGRQSGAAYLGGALLPAAAGWIAQRSLDAVAWSIIGGVLLLLVSIRQLNRVT